MNEPAVQNDEQIKAAYREHNGRLLARSVIVANAIALVGMPSGITLDYFLYPDRFAQFVGIRFGVDAVLLVFMAILHLQRANPSRTWARVLGILSLLVMTSSFSLMMFLTDGEQSPYFAGIILVLMTWSSLLPWSVVDTLIMSLGSLAIYAAACIMNPGFKLPESLPLFGFNTSFILITTLVCSGMTIFLSRVRFEDFRLRHRLDVQNRELQDLDRLKTQFFSNVSHELRTPLTLILGPVETILTNAAALDAKTHEGLLLVHRNTLRLLKLINDLLDLTRLDLGGEVLRKKQVQLGGYLKGMVDSVRHIGLAKRLRFRVEEGDPAATAVFDPARMEKVLVNLLTNAIKYTPAGGTITVRWSADAEGAAIEVADTGVGIPKEDLSKIFDRFHQVRSNTANQTQGVGIGLALAKELVEQHGGTIDVESTEGNGSTFRIRLPVAEEDADASDEALPEPATIDLPEGEEPFEKAFRSADRSWRSQTDGTQEDLPVVGQGKEVVLVADDEPDMRRYVVSLLSENHRVVQTQDGGNVATLVAEHRPDLVLLDWMMPRKDGLTVCRELRANPAFADVKIMLLTARVDEKSKIDALEAGADDFLTKPFSSVEVKTRVANLLRTGGLQKDLRESNAELRRTIEKLQRTELMLIQSEKMNAIGSLSAGLLHEINNPLNYTLTAVAVARQAQDSLSDDMKDLLADIEEGMERIRDVITHLKDFAYPEKQDQRSVFPIRQALENAQKIAAKDLMGIEIDVDIPEDLAVCGQKTQLTHVFINLFGNAAKALAVNPPGAPRRIEIRSQTHGERAIIEFADSGPGIDEKIIGRIFEPFFTTRDVGSGMGMGLSICHTIMASHGGVIRAANRPQGGAVFTIEIPTAELALNTC
jgi:Osmosensitive K+ channel histidine kinase